MLKLRDALIKILYVLMVVGPFFVAIVTGLVCLTAGWQWLWPGCDYLHFLIQEKFGHWFGAILLVIVLLWIGAGAYMLGDRLTKKGKLSKKVLISCLLVMVITFVPRLVLFAIFGADAAPSSDDANMWQLVKGNLPLSVLGHYTFFPAYLNYATYMKAIASISGYRFSAVLLSNLFVNTITGVEITLATYIAGKRHRTALLSGIIYALYPAGIIYTLTATPEHLCIMFLMAMIICLLLALRQEEYHRGVLFMALAGFFAGISNSFKSFIPVVLVALVIILILHAIGEKYSMSQIGILIVGLAILIACQSFSGKLIQKATAEVFDVNIDASDAMPHFIVVGLNREGEGQVHLGDMSHHYTELREVGVDADTARTETVELLVNDWKNHLDQIPSFIGKKLVWAWQDDYGPVRIFGYASELPESSLLSFIRGPVATASQILYILLIVVALIVAITSLSGKYGFNMYEVFNDLIIYGYFWLMLIVEAQSRYKCLIIPFLCVMAARLLTYILDTKRD